MRQPQGHNREERRSGGMQTEEAMYYAIAGAISGLSASFYTCPLDVVKTKIQSQIHPTSSTLTGSPLLAGDSPLHRTYSIPLYRGTLPTLRRILKEEGIKGWYRGIGPTIVGYLPTWSIYFTTYHHFKAVLSSPSLPPPVVHVLSAVAAGAMSSTATNPLWVIRTRLMTQAKGQTPFYYKNAIDALVTIVRTEGWTALYKGLTPSLLGTTHVAIQLPLYEFLKSTLSRHHVDQLDARAVLVSSVVSKTMASIVSYPHELIRTRLQNQSSVNPGALGVQYRGLFHAIVKIYREESLSGFYRGLPTNLAKVVPASAITFVSFETIISYFRSKNCIRSHMIEAAEQPPTIVEPTSRIMK